MWVFVNNISSWSKKKLDLLFTAEFPCNEAVVIPLSQRCDGNNDCPASPWARERSRTADESLYECKPEGMR